jgi:transposase
MSSRACSNCGSKSSEVKGNSVGESFDCSMLGISSASIRIARWA